MRFAIRSDIGRVRPVNEDRADVFTHPTEPSHFVAVVADGMGGHKGGDVASTMAVDIVQREYERLVQPHSTEEEWSLWLRQTIRLANETIYKYASTHEQYKGMGTTLDIAVVTDQFLHIGHVGDSRVYLCTDQLQQVTKDHSFVNALVDSGAITEEEAEVHPKKNWIVQAIGAQERVRFDVATYSLQHVRAILLCTDGLSNEVTTEELQTILRSSKTSEQKVETMIERANEYGGEDNISVILFERVRKESSS